MGLRQEMRELRDATPGTRFQEGSERTRVDNRVMRVGLILLGLALMVTATVTFWLPGPNFVLVLAGLALIGGQSAWVARQMDRGEVVARRWKDERWDPYPHKVRVKAFGLVLFWLAFAGIALLAVWQDFVPGWIPEGWYRWVPVPS